MNQENDLLLQIQQDSTIAFEKLYFNLQPRLFAFSKKFIDDSETARDIVQEIFLEFWESRQTIHIKISINAYLFRILHNKCLNYIRDKKVHEKYTSYVDVKLKESELIFFYQDQESYKSIFFKELEDIFRISMENLPESCREIFLLSRISGLSNKEIADKLNFPVRTVENQIYRALKILKVELKDYLYFFPFLFKMFS
jgi:RNA polymerase sigma-70 factor, ECF subfamily